MEMDVNRGLPYMQEVSVEEAQARILGMFRTLESERKPLLDALGQVLAEWYPRWIFLPWPTPLWTDTPCVTKPLQGQPTTIPGSCGSLDTWLQASFLSRRCPA